MYVLILWSCILFLCRNKYAGWRSSSGKWDGVREGAGVWGKGNSGWRAWVVVEGVCRGERKWVGVVKGKTGRWGEWDVVSEGVGMEE